MILLACFGFVIRYCQLQVTENPDSTRSNNKECIMSPHKKPGDRVVLGWFTQQVSGSTGQPGSSYLSVLRAQCAGRLPSRLQEGLHPPPGTPKGQLKGPLSQAKNGSIFTGNHLGSGGTPGFALWQG